MDVYRERAHLLAHLAAIYPSRLIRGADPQEPDWPVLFIELPTPDGPGQLTWHISPNDLDLFEHVSDEPTNWTTWDGHSTEEKYRRLDKGSHQQVWGFTL